MRRPLFALAALAFPIAFSIAGLSCRYDPVPQELINELGPEQGAPGPNHRPGQPCLACHSKYAGSSPQMVFGGTVYTTNPDGVLGPASGVSVLVSDSAGDSRKACTNAAGNFYLDKTDWKEVAFPLTVKAGKRGMRSLIGRDGSCGSCHKPADADHPERDPVSGASFDSAGIVTVDFTDTGECGAGQ